MNKSKALQLLLTLGALYFLIGAVAHLFGLTIFPFYDGRLYAPYHDTVIALSALALAIFLLSVARDPIKNADGLKAVIAAGAIAVIFNIGILWKIDFAALGAPVKKAQTMIEMMLLAGWLALLICLRPREQKQ